MVGEVSALPLGRIKTYLSLPYFHVVVNCCPLKTWKASPGLACYHKLLELQGNAMNPDGEGAVASTALADDISLFWHNLVALDLTNGHCYGPNNGLV